MSEAKAETPPAGAKAPDAAAPEAKPAEAHAAPAAPAKAPEAPKPVEAKPAPAAKAPEAKPAPAPAPAAAKAPEVKAPEGPKPGSVGVRAPAPKSAETNVNITITAKAAVMIMGGLCLLVLLLGSTTVFMLVRMADRHPLDKVTYQGPGQEGKGLGGNGPIAGAPVTEAPVAEKPAAPEAPEKVEIGVNFKDDFGGKAGSLPGSWTAFRGANYDNVVTDAKLANKWPAAGPPVKWTVSGLGEGYSGAAALAGRVYLQDYDAKTKEESLRCFSLDDGKEIWRRSYAVKILNNHGFTRTVPAVTEKYVVSMGSKCHVLCVDAATGGMKWGLDLMKDYGTKMPDWYTAQCPIIDGNAAIIAPGGKDILIMGVELETGKILWKTPNPGKLAMSHSSVTPMTFKGKKMYLYCAEWGKLVGISADAADVGAVLFEVTCLDKQVIAPSPVVMEDGYVFMTAGYEGGSSLVQVSEAGGKFEAKVLWKLDQKEGLSCEQQTPVYYNKHMFALMPDSSGGRKQQLVCMNPYDKGKVVWDSGKEKRFGQYEPILLADGKFYVLSKDCRLTLVKASTQKYEELGQCKVLQGHDAWAPIALVGDRLIIRDSTVMVCLDVGKSIE